MISILLAFALCQPAPVAPKASILDRNGNPPPSEIQAGEAIYFSGVKAERGANTVSVLLPVGDKYVLQKIDAGMVWLVDPPERKARAEKFEGGTILVVPTGTVDCTLRVTQIVAKGEQADVATVTVKIIGLGPQPPPGPAPLPDPTLSDVGKASKAEAEKLTGAARAKAKDVGAALRKAGQEVMDNSLSKPADVLSLIRSKTNAVLGNLADAWKPWGVAVALKMKDANPTTPAVWADLLQQAAEGLEAVK